MNKAWVVARHEFLVTVRRISFILFTFVFPVVMAGIPVVMQMVSKPLVEERRREVIDRPLGVVDEWNGLRQKPAFPIRRYGDEASAKAALLAREVGAYIVVPSNYVESGAVRVVFQRKPSLFSVTKPPPPRGARGLDRRQPPGGRRGDPARARQVPVQRRDDLP